MSQIQGGAQKKPTKEEFLKNKRGMILSQTEFPSESIPVGFKELLRRALIYNSIRRLQCLGTTYENMIKWNRAFLMPEMEICIEVIKAATPFEIQDSMKYSDDEILSMLENNLQMLKVHTTDVLTKWGEIDEAICEPIRREIDAKSKLIVPRGKEAFRD